MCRRDLLSCGQILQKINHFEVGLERFRRKARKILPQVVRVVELHVPGNLAGQETLSQWAPGDKTDAELFAERKLRSFGLAHPQGIVVLDCGHRLDGMGATNVLGARFRQAEMFDLAFRDQLFDGARHVFHRDRRIDPVLIEEVNVVFPKTFQRSVDHLADMFGLDVEPDHLVFLVNFEAELCAD